MDDISLRREGDDVFEMKLFVLSIRLSSSALLAARVDRVAFVVCAEEEMIRFLVVGRVIIDEDDVFVGVDDDDDDDEDEDDSSSYLAANSKSLVCDLCLYADNIDADESL